MGERNEIKLTNDGIFLYSHWDTKEDLKKVLKDALIRGKGRWNDRPYLNRIIFSEMIKDDVLSETGFGLSCESMGDTCLDVDVDNQTVNGVSFEKFVK